MEGMLSEIADQWKHLDISRKAHACLICKFRFGNRDGLFTTRSKNARQEEWQMVIKIHWNLPNAENSSLDYYYFLQFEIAC